MFQGFLEVGFCLLYSRIPEQVHGALKMQMQAPVVHVDGAYHSFRVITGKYLGMYKARHILIDLHAGLKKLRVIRPGQEVRIDLVRNMRHDDDRLNTALCRKRQ